LKELNLNSIFGYLSFKLSITSKEKREIGFMIGAVLIVAVIGIVLSSIAPNVGGRFVGQVIKDPNAPTYPGMLDLLENDCHWTAINGTNTCDELCGTAICLPLEANCDTVMSSGQCRCCEVPE